MATNSNLYAEKIFAEHPLALYPLDETVDYVSLIAEADRNITTWTATNIQTVATSSLQSTAPFPSSYATSFKQNGNIASPGTLKSSNTFTIPPLDSFAIGFYIYLEAYIVGQLDIGYQIGSNTPVLHSQPVTFGTSDSGKWIFISKSFAATAGSAPSGASIYLKFTYTSNTNNTSNIHINGISVGSWSEEFNSKSLGIPSTAISYVAPGNSQSIYTLSTYSTTINTTSSYGVISNAYSDSNIRGFYISNNNKLFARSSSVPMVYGSQNSTILSPNDTAGQPSFIFPGFGFMNENGKFADRTFEGWFRINAVNPSMKKIFGPLEYNDGLYANGGCLILKIANNLISYNVDEWNKPMLIQIQISLNSATLFVNGENAGSMFFDSKSTPFQAYTVSSKNADWLGVYAYSTEVESVEIDCIAIYSYKPPIEIIKRRFVYGQGVNYPETIDFQFNGSSFVTENSVSNTTQVYNYPIVGKWKEGIIDNVLPNTYYIKTPEYSLPNFYSSKYNFNNFLADLYTTSGSVGTNQFITMRPTTVVSGSGRDWSTVDSYLLFNRFQMLYDNVISFYGIFIPTESSSSEQYLMRIEDNKQNVFSISILGTTVYYKFNGSTLSSKTVSVGNTFGAGIDIPSLISANLSNSALVQFWSNLHQLKMYVGGSNITSAPGTFSGKIFRIGFSNSRNHTAANFTSGYWSKTSGITNYSGTLNLPSYSLFTKKVVDLQILDIGISGHWQKDIPLQYFSTKLDDGTYTFDYLQFNVDIPESDTSNVNTYITLQNYIDGSNAFSESYSSATAPTNYLISNAVVGTKYNVYDGTIIYPDSSVIKESTSIVIHIDFSVAGIITNPIQVNTLKLASQIMSSGNTSQNQITSRFGLNLTPFGAPTYKPKIAIYAVDNPYLYLTNNSGIQNLSGYINQDSGYYSIINPNKDSNFQLDYIQLTFKNDIDLGTTPLKLFSVLSDSGSPAEITFYLNNIGNRYYIEAQQGGSVLKTISYYWNGNRVFTPTFKKNEWGTLGIAFTSFPDLSGTTGKFKVFGPSLIQNFSYYAATAKQLSQSYQTTTWSLAFTSTWGAASGTWSALTLVKKDYLPIDVSQLYSVYTGTNIIIPNIDDTTVGHYLSLGKYEYITYTGIRTEVKDTTVV